MSLFVCPRKDTLINHPDQPPLKLIYLGDFQHLIYNVLFGKTTYFPGYTSIMINYFNKKVSLAISCFYQKSGRHTELAKGQY
jgi:hypothetical protein